MEPKLQIRVQRYGWDAAAELYEDGWCDPLAPAQETLLKVAAIKPGERVIEAACGSGLVTKAVASAVGPAGAVLATDLSQNMVDLTARTCAEAGYGWVTTARMSADDLAVEPESFDAAVCALGLMYVPDPGKAALSMARAVRTGGRVVATVWGERRNCGWAEIFPIVDARVVSEVCPLFFASGTPGSLRRDFEQAGLRHVEEHRQRETLEFAHERSLLSAMLQGGPVALAVKRFTPETIKEVEAEFLDSVKDHRAPDGSYRIPGEFVTVIGYR
ncbi:methyltransferase domain-containing protein [Mesorhizobium sp. KR9-304]|uniref:class I SAM-dependent methyltransferase n=1 Tax=Mesorhizobium sp. KR9-304 TaxID=3156614 RepID=UPI0032B4B246